MTTATDFAESAARQREVNDQLAKDGWMKERKAAFPSVLADKFMLRLPDGVRDRIAASAKVSGRTMNAEIGYHVQRSMGHLPGASGIDLVAIPTADLLAELGRRCER